MASSDNLLDTIATGNDQHQGDPETDGNGAEDNPEMHDTEIPSLEPENRRIPGCVCERCPPVPGTVQVCCGHPPDRCLAPRTFMTQLLAAEDAVDRSEEATRLGNSVEKSHRFHAFRDYGFYKRYRDYPWANGRMKFPNCCENRIREKWPGPPGEEKSGYKPGNRRRPAPPTAGPPARRRRNL